MFGFKSSNKSDAEEAEARRIETMKASVATAIEHMKQHAEAGNTERCEAAAKRLTESLKNPKLPGEFTKSAREAVDALLLHAYMKATASAAKAAIAAGRADEVEVRNVKIKQARDLLSGAVKARAPAEFKMQVEKLLDVAQFSGGVKAKGPTKAKPKDTAPKPPDRAKTFIPDPEPESGEKAAAKAPKPTVGSRQKR